MAGVVMWGDKGGQAGGGWPALCALEGVGHAGMLNDHGELKRRVNFWKVFSLQSTPEVFQVQGRECGCRAAPAHPCPGVHIPSGGCFCVARVCHVPQALSPVLLPVPPGPSRLRHGAVVMLLQLWTVPS